MNMKTLIGLGMATPSVAGVIDPNLPAIHTDWIAGVAILLACIGGSYASFSWGEPVEPRARMFRLFVSCVLMGLFWSLILNWIIGWWLPNTTLTISARAGIGGVVSCITRFVMPKIIDSIKDGSWKELIPFIGKRQ